ncbi:hypothetical protein RZO07_14700 [Pseudomonas protegens]|uniref:hypothetical protein n=1 Tax=Pseudomonas protegens TaxID=380021 RepID=UPI0029371FA7|nr:hypothetical protein [Pseudomonas protegens]WOE82413.1 hypothetical protein RZO07_14700 [Pseudomonas protegens]
MNIFQTDIRKICLVGPSSGSLEQSDSRYLWVAHLTALYDKDAKANHGAMRNPSLRVLAEAAKTRPVSAEKYNFHDPQLFSLAVRPEVGWWSSLFFHALPSGQEATAISRSIGNGQKFDAFTIVTAVPALAQNQGKWPDKTADEIQVPPLRLTAGSIQMLVTQETDKKHKNKVGYWTLLQATNGGKDFLSLFGKSGDGTMGVFVPATPGAFKVLQDSLAIADDGADANSKESGDSTEKALGNGQPPRFAIDLTPEGIEFDAQVRFSRDTQVSVRLRLEARVKDGKARFVLVLLEDRKSFLRNGLDQVAASLRRGGHPVALDLRPGTPRIVWALESRNDRLTLADVHDFALEPESVRVSLLGDPPAGATGRTAARLSSPQAKVHWGETTPRKIAISAGDETSNAAPVAMLSVRMDAESGPRRFGFQLGNSTAGGQPTGDVAVIVDATPAGSPSSVFLALERGVARLPRPSEDMSIPSASETNAFEGLIHLKSTSLDKGVSTITVDAAARATVVIEYDATVTRLETTFQGPVGVLDGYLWAATGLPSGEEIVPTLDNGPISLCSLPMLFGGNAPLKGYKASIAALTASPALTVTLETADATLWAPHPGTMRQTGGQLPPVVSAVSMTRTLPSATEPSRTRDLVPVAYQPKSGRNAVRLELALLAQGPGLPLASVEGTISRFGWPDADVPLAAVTLPGVEYATTDKVTPTLRFDLPLLDDFHASATPNRKRREEDQKTKPASAVTADTPKELDAFWKDQSRRRRLMRSADDIVWSDTTTGSVAMPFAMSGSVTFEAKNGTGLPLGAYTIEGKLQYGEEALAGLSASYRIDSAAGSTLVKDDNGPIRITGFATAPFEVTIGKKRPAGSTAGDAWQDTRGHAFAKTFARKDVAILRRSHRHTAPDNVEVRTLITSLQPTKVQIASSFTAFLAFRDLPTTQVEDGSFKFQAGSELSADPYSRTDLPSSVYEWRHYAAADEGKSVAHDIGFGPLRLKPLRLEIARFSPDGACSQARVEYRIDLAASSVGSDQSGKASPYGPDDAYRTGSVFSVNYEVNGGSAALKARTLAQDGKTDEARVGFRVLADCSDDQKTPSIAVDVTFGLKVSTNGIEVKESGGELKLKLFGLQRTFKNARVGLDNDVLTIEATPGLETRAGLAIKGVKLTLSRDRTPKFDIEATLMAAPVGIHSALVVDIGRRVKLYASEIPAEGKCRINHETGVVSVNLSDDASTPIKYPKALARGLPPSTTAQGSMVFVLQAAELGTPFAQAIAAARADLHLRGDCTLEARFLLQVEDQKTTRRRLTLSLGSPVFNSVISWPTAAIDGGNDAGKAVIADLMSATALAWKTSSAGSSMITVAVTPGKQPVTHDVQPILEGFDIPEQAIQHNGSGWIVAKPVRIKAVTHHRLKMGEDKSLSWSAIDDVTLIDVERFVTLASGEETKDLAFSPRFREPNANKNDKADPNEVPVAGIVKTAPFGRAIGHYLQANTGPFKQGLALIGAAVHEAVLEKEQALTFGLPWIRFIEGAEAQTQTPAPPPREWPLPSIPQMPSHGTSKPFTISLFDLAAAVPHQRNGTAPLSLSVRGRQIVDLMDELQRLKIDPALRVADLAFASNLPAYPVEDTKKQDPKVPDIEAPIFWRTLMALKRLFEVKDTTTLSFLTVFGDPRMERAVRIAPVAGDLLGATQQAVKARVFVFDHQRVEVSDLPATLSFDLVSASVDAQRRVLLDARTAIANPLAVKVARVVAAAQGGKEIVDLANEHHEGGIAIDSIRQQALTPGHALRPPKDQTIHPEPSLSWPEFGQLGKAAESALNIGEESPIQDKDVAWAGRARRFAGTLVAGATEKAPASSTDPVKFQQAAFLAVGRRVIFARNTGADAPTVTAPPDRALTPVPPRARAPLAERIEAAFTGDGEKHVGNFLPGHYELLSTGVRPGAMMFEHTGVLHTSNPLGFDADHTHFGRPAERAPVVWTQGRAPRSTGLPKVNELDLRRRTFVGENIQNGEHLNELALLAGAAGVIRYLPSTVQEGGDSVFAKQTVAIFVRVKTPLTESHRRFASGKLKLVFERPLSATDGASAQPLSEVLTSLGFLGQTGNKWVAPLYSLTIGDTVVRAGTPTIFTRKSVDKSKRCAIVTLVFADGFGAIRQALVSATADTRALLDIRAGLKRSPSDTAPPALATEPQRPPLLAGPPRTLSIRLPVLPAFGPYLPIPTATLAFGDPAYDRELAGPAKTAIWRDPTTKGRTLMLSLDRPAYDVGETIHFAAGELNPGFFAPASLADPTPPEPFTPRTTASWTLGIEWLPKPLEGRASVVCPLVIADPAITDEQATTYRIDGVSAYGVAIAALRMTNGSKPAFKEGDRLNFTVKMENTPPLTVAVTLVDEPVIAPSPAVYSLVTLDTVGAAQPIATPVLYASAPLPTTLEFPDLLTDLARGHVRRRGLFVWRFVPRTAKPSAALIKIDRTGGGQIPSDESQFVAMQ